jgi:hypothetical protein
MLGCLGQVMPSYVRFSSLGYISLGKVRLCKARIGLVRTGFFWLRHVSSC